MNTEIALPAAELKQALSGFNRMVGRKTTLPILGHVRISRQANGQVQLQATDLDAHATYTLSAHQTGEPVDLLVPLEQLNKAFKSSSTTKQDVALVLEGQHTRLRYYIAGNSVQQPINTLPLDEWPVQPKIEVEPKLLQPGFGTALKQALQCCSDDPSRQILQGACLDARDTKGHYIVATNGKFLYSANSFTFPLKEAVIIPDSKFINGAGLLDVEPCYLAVQPGKKPNDIRHICLNNQQWQFVTREIDGQYPNWKQVLPELDAKWTAVELSEPAIAQLLAVIPNLPGKDDRNNAVRLRLVDQVMWVDGRNPDDKDYTSIAVQEVKIKGGNVQVWLNRDYLVPALQFGMKSWAILDELTPVVLTRGGKRMVIMPIRPDGPPPTQAAAQPSTASAGVPPAAEDQPKAEDNQSTMNKTATKSEPVKPAEPQTTLTMIDQVERVKETLKNALRELTGLTDLARQMERDKRAGDKEVETARAVLKKLQSVSI